MIMKNLKDFINESQNINESSINERDFDKVDNVLANDNKLKKFIKDHEKEATEMGFSNDDIKDIMAAMLEIHSNLSFMDSDDDREDYLEDCIDDLADSTGADKDMVKVAIDFYKSLFKEVTHKELND